MATIVGNIAPDSSLSLGKRREVDYGKAWEGQVEMEDRTIDIVWREPSQFRTNVAYVMANGLGGARASMWLPAHEAVNAKYAAVTFNYTNRRRSLALEQNTTDFAGVVNSLPEELTPRGMGVSMGGRVVARAMLQARLQAATLIAPAGMWSRDPSKREVASHFITEGPELVDLFLSGPINAAYLTVSSIQNFVERRQAIPGELHDASHGNEHDTLRTVSSGAEPPRLRLLYGRYDKLIPAWVIEEGLAQIPGVFDETVPYNGGHMAALRNPEISRLAFERDKALPVYTGGLALAA